MWETITRAELEATKEELRTRREEISYLRTSLRSGPPKFGETFWLTMIGGGASSCSILGAAESSIAGVRPSWV